MYIAVMCVLGFFTMSGFLAWLFLVLLYFGWATVHDEKMSDFTLDALHNAFSEGFYDQWGPYNEADTAEIIADCERCWMESVTRKVFLETAEET